MYIRTQGTLAPLVLSIFWKGWGKHRANVVSFTSMLAALATGGLPELDLANVSLISFGSSLLPYCTEYTSLLPEHSVFLSHATPRLICGGQVCNRLNNGTFPGTSPLKCKTLSSDIKSCQAKGKLVTLSLGGAVGNVSFTGDDQAKDFAEKIWDLFLGGSSGTRPFGNAVLDG